MKKITLLKGVLPLLIAFLFCKPSSAQYKRIVTNDTVKNVAELVSKYQDKGVQHNNNGSQLRDDRPNIIFILVDDSRWDSYSVNGSPSFFSTPNIDRLANEGVNFKNFFAVLPLCTPSRGVFFTGLYPHINGAVTNPTNIHGGIPWISSILQDAGYYTCFAGKLGFSPDSIRGFDKFLINTIESYMPSQYDFWTGSSVAQVFIQDHTTDVIKDMAIQDIYTRPLDKPFFLYLPERAPHVPYIPRPQDEGKFAEDTMPYPVNHYKYETNFPGYYYPDNQAGDSVTQAEAYLGYFQMLIGVEETLGELWNYLESNHVIPGDTLSPTLMDNTLIIFSSDNGDVKSEHLLQGKQLPIEESIRLPLFMRFPQWFPVHKDITDEIGTNLDWATTILDAAGIPNTYGMNGLSLRALANHEVHRNAMLYEVWSEVEQVNKTPAIRAVRTQYFKYIRSFCSDTTEQLFDLVNDPHEDTNLINDPSYQYIAQYYRCKLDSFRAVTHDDSVDIVISCHLKNPDYSHVGFSLNPGPLGTCIFPVFDQDTAIEVIGIDEAQSQDNTWDISIYNLYGNLLRKETRLLSVPPTDGLVLHSPLPTGLYLGEFTNKKVRMVKKVIVQ